MASEIKELYDLEHSVGESMVDVRKVTLAEALDVKGSRRQAPSRALSWALEKFREARAHLRKLREDGGPVARQRVAQVARDFVKVKRRPTPFGEHSPAVRSS